MSLRFTAVILSASGVFVFWSGHLVSVECLCVLEWISCWRLVSLFFRVDILSVPGVFVF